jgi:hypothetical protein
LIRGKKIPLFFLSSVSSLGGNAMAAEVLMGIGALKSAFDLTKGLKDIDDRVRLNDARMELQEKILEAQQAQATLLERIGDLEKQITSFEKWEAEKENYQLVSIFAETLAYARKPSADGSIPPHYICANCYEDRKKRILQRADAAHVACPDCKVRLRFDSEEVKAFNRPLTPRGGGSWMSS